MEKERLQNYIAQMKITLTDQQAEQFLLYYKLLIEWNSFMNLTAITAPEEVLIKHFADSLALSCFKAYDLRRALRLMDIGTGAGFPAIPLKIAFPSLQITMIDALQKRVNFLQEVITQLGLSGITALHGRAEDFARDMAHRERYDLVVSRAVANMAVLAEYCLPYVKRDGCFVAYKSTEFLTGEEKTSAEGALLLLGGTWETVQRYQLPKTDMDRCLAVVRKVSATPKKYPRRAGTAGKEPLR